MKIINVLAVTLLLFSVKTQAQRVHFGFDLGAGFTNIKTNDAAVSNLPSGRGGTNFHYGAHLDVDVVKKFGLEFGLQKVTKGFTELVKTPNSSLPLRRTYRITTLSVPVMAVFHVIDYDNGMPFRLSGAAGFYYAYTLQGRLYLPDNNPESHPLNLSNTKRSEIGPRLMIKAQFKHKFEIYGASDFAVTNVRKNSDYYVKQGSVQVGVGLTF